MNNSIIDEEARRADIDLKVAQAKKAIAEAESLTATLQTKKKSKKNVNWQEMVKTVGATILGMGGIVAAFTQHQIAQKDAQIAQIKIATAEQQLEVKRQEIDQAIEELKAVSDKREIVEKELIDAENEKNEAKLALKQYQIELENLTAKVVQEKPELVKEHLIYIQFRGSLARTLINQLRNELKIQGFNNPGAERIAGEYRSIVKYFSDSDAIPAEELAQATEAFFAQKGCPLTIEVIRARTKSGSASAVEMWLDHSCS